MSTLSTSILCIIHEAKNKRSLEFAFTEKGFSFSYCPFKHAGGTSLPTSFNSAVTKDKSSYSKILAPIKDGDLEMDSKSVMDVKFSDLITFQTYVYTPDDRFTPTSELIRVFDIDGLLYIKDGNHRATMEWLKGYNSIKANVIKWR